MHKIKIEIGDRENLIYKGFICGWIPSTNEKPMRRCWIKLDQIKNVQHCGWDNGKEVSGVFTYRDVSYYVFMDAIMIIDAIDEFSSKDAKNERTKPTITGIYAKEPIEC